MVSFALCTPAFGEIWLAADIHTIADAVWIHKTRTIAQDITVQRHVSCNSLHSLTVEQQVLLICSFSANISGTHAEKYTRMLEIIEYLLPIEKLGLVILPLSIISYNLLKSITDRDQIKHISLAATF